MDCIIRRAEQRDADAIAMLYRTALGYAEMTGKAVSARMTQMAARGGYINYVAEVNGAVAGMISTRRSLALEVNGEYMAVIGLMVSDEFRGMGLGRALIMRAESDARMDGITFFKLSSGMTRTGADAFYEKLGYQKNGFRFTKGQKN